MTGFWQQTVISLNQSFAFLFFNPLPPPVITQQCPAHRLTEEILGCWLSSPVFLKVSQVCCSCSEPSEGTWQATRTLRKADKEGISKCRWRKWSLFHQGVYNENCHKHQRGKKTSQGWKNTGTVQDRTPLGNKASKQLVITATPINNISEFRYNLSNSGMVWKYWVMDGTVPHCWFTFVRSKHPQLTESKYVMLSSLTGGNKKCITLLFIMCPDSIYTFSLPCMLI